MILQNLVGAAISGEVIKTWVLAAIVVVSVAILVWLSVSDYRKEHRDENF